MGFGSGKFGKGPIGSTNWAKQVLFDLYPEIYRRLDVDNDDLLQKWSIGIGLKYQDFRKQIQNWNDLRDPDKIPTKYTEAVNLRLGRVISSIGEVLQAGLFGSVDIFGSFTARSARFTDQDIGRTVVLTSVSPTSINNASFQIAAILSQSVVQLDTPPAVESNLAWQVRDRSEAPDQVTFEVWQGDVSEIVPGSTLFDGTTEFNVIARSQYPEVGSSNPFLDREGLDGFFWNPSDLPAVTVFVSPTAKFTAADIGKVVSIPAVGDHEGVIRNRIQNTVVTTDAALAGMSAVVLTYVDLTFEGNPLDNIVPLVTLATPSTPTYWAILPRPTLTVSGRDLPRGLISSYGFNGVVAASGTNLSDPVRQPFSFDMVGNSLSMFIPKKAGLTDPEIFEGSVSSYVSPSVIGLGETPYAGSRTSIYYEIRTPSTLGDTRSVSVYSPSLIEFLAEEFGASLSRVESDIRQRALVRNVLQWADRKGQADSYRILGSLSGWSVAVDQAHRINLTLAAGMTIPASEYVEDLLGMSGSDGRMNYVNGALAFSASSAIFTRDHIGTNIRVTGATDPGKNKYYTIANLIDKTTVGLASNDLVPSEVGSVPDVSDGSLNWYSVRLYTKRPPRAILMDEFNHDLLSTYLKGYFSVPDQYDWQNASSFPDLTNTGNINIELTSVSLGSKTTWTVTTRDTQILSVDENILYQLGETITSTAGGIAVFRVRGSVFTSGTQRSDVVTGSNGLFSTTIEPNAGNIAGLGTGVAGPVQSVGVVSRVGNWKIIDSAGTTFWMESLPILTSGASIPSVYTFSVSSYVAPALGMATLAYDAPELPMPGLSPESAVLLTIHNVDSAISQADFLARLEDCTPIHVRPIVKVI